MSGWSRAHGKVILLGEHAVVYGIPAIAVGIHRGATARVTPKADGPNFLALEGVAAKIDADDGEQDIARAFRALLQVSGRGGEGDRVELEVRTEVPPGGGLGCSAALGVAIVRALNPGLEDSVAAERAMEWERTFHGNPSGVDAAIAACGGCIAFERGRGYDRVPVPAPGLVLCVGDSGSPSSTKAMVDAVARMRERRPEMVGKLFEGILSLVKNARLAIEAGDVAALGRFMDLNQMLLSGLFLSTPDIERMCAAARDSGALGAKLTGAGGGGCVVALASDDASAERVLAAWKQEGFSGFRADVAGAPAREAVDEPVVVEPIAVGTL